MLPGRRVVVGVKYGRRSRAEAQERRRSLQKDWVSQKRAADIELHTLASSSTGAGCTSPLPSCSAFRSSLFPSSLLPCCDSSTSMISPSSLKSLFPSLRSPRLPTEFPVSVAPSGSEERPSPSAMALLRRGAGRVVCAPRA